MKYEANMKFDVVTDYQTYREIMDELLCPIIASDLDPELVVRLYQSKLVYLENLRSKCFYEINRDQDSLFNHDDYKLILEAQRQTKQYLRHTMMTAISHNLAKRKAV